MRGFPVFLRVSVVNSSAHDAEAAHAFSIVKETVACQLVVKLFVSNLDEVETRGKIRFWN